MDTRGALGWPLPQLARAHFLCAPVPPSSQLLLLLACGLGRVTGRKQAPCSAAVRGQRAGTGPAPRAWTTWCTGPVPRSLPARLGSLLSSPQGLQKCLSRGPCTRRKKYLPYRPTCLFRRSSDMFSDCWFPLQVPAASGAGSDQARSQTLHLNLPLVAGAQAPPGSLGRELARQWSSWDWNPRSDVECGVLVARPAVSPPPWTSRAVSPPTRYAAV